MQGLFLLYNLAQIQQSYHEHTHIPGSLGMETAGRVRYYSKRHIHIYAKKKRLY